MNNLAVKTFLSLRDIFFDKNGEPQKFDLRDKLNTQDDPFDEYIASSLNTKLQISGILCQPSSGPLISPDMAVYVKDLNVDDIDIINNPNKIIGIEVKKLERSSNNSIARPSGMDYNSTPPCGKIQIYTANDKPIIIKGFYLFACLERDKDNKYYVSAMCLCDGSILNDDFELYKQITGSREKSVGIGTYGDGANRNRPMLIFSNPLGTPLLDKKITLISGVDLGEILGDIKIAWRFIRIDTKNNRHIFHTYMKKTDLADNYHPTEILEPFLVPKKRISETQKRGKFKLLIER